MRNGSPEEKQGFQNVRTHFLQHKQFAMQQQAQAAAAHPPSEQVNFKDLDTPQEKAQMLSQVGIRATPPQQTAQPTQQTPQQVQ